MALSYSIEGLGVIADADAVTNDSGGTGTGDWGTAGSGGISATLTTDTFYFGTACITIAVSGNNKQSWLYFDRGAGNELDFGASGTEENQFIYIWVHCPTIGLTKTLANEGVSIRVGSSTSDYRIFVIAGSDESNGWDGGWQCFVVDPTKTGSLADVGTPNLSSIRYIGAQIETTATAKGDNLFISQIAVGSGIRMTGTSTTAWADAVAYTTDLANRAWGMLQEREGIYYAYGNIIIGDGTATTDFDDEGRVIQFGISEYWSGTGTVFDSFLPTTASGITLDDGTGTTTFTDGVIVGTDNGRSGSTIIGNNNENVFLDFDGLTNAGSDINLYGTTIRGFEGAIALEPDTDHAYLGVSWIACAQVAPQGGAVMRNNTFAETADADAALLWDGSIDIQDSNFIANTLGAAIEVTQTTTQTFDNLVFSGNTNDVLLNNGGNNININNTNGANASTQENIGGGTVTFVNSESVTINVIDRNGDGINGAQVSMYASDDNTEIIAPTDTTGGSAGTPASVTTSYGGTTPRAVYYRVRKSSTGDTKYVNDSAVGTINSGTGLTATRTLRVDTIADPTI